MVSLWPWRGDSSSTASFEKTLSTLSVKIKDTQARLDKVRSSSRRVKVLSTLYLGFAYLVYGIVQLLVVGRSNMGVVEWTGLAGGPVVIYIIRKLLTAYFSFRIESLESRLKEQQEERANTIQKLKDATKYDSTMELIEKYGGVEGRPDQDKNSSKKKTPSDGAVTADSRPGSSEGKQLEPRHPGRTSLPPPPTANIQRRASSQHQPSTLEPTAEFAPNAEHFPPQPASPYPPANQQLSPAQQQPAEAHWYDRIFDVLLGEDETAPKNRIVLLCSHCRLVNGQAPPGVKSLGEVGRWRCMGCGGENGEVEDEGRRIVREVLDAQAGAGDQEGDDDASTDDETASAKAVSSGKDSQAASTRKRRGGGKK